MLCHIYLSDRYFCRTYTAVERLEADRRREELARLTGGAHITPAMLAGAGELLDSAETYKRRLT